MKLKILFFGLFFLACFQANAQFGIRVGTNLSNVRIESDAEGIHDVKINDKYGFYGGFTYDFGKYLVFQPGIYFSQKGYFMDSLNTISQEKTSGKYTINYVEAPLNLMVKMHFGIVRIYVGGGVVFSYGLGKKVSDDNQVHASMEFDVIKDGEKKSFYIDEAFDFGAQLVGGIEIGPFSVNANYNLSQMSLYKEKKFYNRACGITVGWTFGN